MDPDQALEDARDRVARIKGDLETSGSAAEADVLELITSVEAIDGWLMAGGFLPADWAKLNDSPPD